MTTKLIVHNDSHPMLSSFKSTGIPCQHIDRMELKGIEEIWDLTLLTTAKKKDLYKKFESAHIKSLHCEMSTCHGAELIKTFPSIQTAFALAIWGPKDQYELWQRNDEDEFSLLEKIPMQPSFVSGPGHCFIYPRVIATLINESRFARLDQLASIEDLDRAMKYGVNYPLGLIEWENKIGSDIIDLILQDLKEVTGSDRYTSL